MTVHLAFEHVYLHFASLASPTRFNFRCEVRKHIADDFTRMEYCKHESRL